MLISGFRLTLKAWQRSVNYKWVSLWWSSFPVSLLAGSPVGLKSKRFVFEILLTCQNRGEEDWGRGRKSPLPSIFMRQKNFEKQTFSILTQPGKPASRLISSGKWKTVSNHLEVTSFYLVFKTYFKNFNWLGFPLWSHIEVYWGHTNFIFLWIFQKTGQKQIVDTRFFLLDPGLQPVTEVKLYNACIVRTWQIVPWSILFRIILIILGCIHLQNRV